MGELGISMVMATIAPTDLALIAQNAADSMALRALQANLQLTCRFDDALIAQCDDDRITQVIDHLIENALRYTAAPGEIVIAGGKADACVTLTIDDTAPAPPDDALPHLFARFYRAEKSRSRAERVWPGPVDLQSVFPPRELVARVKTVLRRTNPPPGTTGAPVLAMDEATWMAAVNGTARDLTRREFQILHVMFNRAGRVYSRAQLLDLTLPDDTSVIDRTIDSHNKNIRAKVKAVRPDGHPIRAVYGVGYAFE
jgi:hypothetical protein